MAALKAQRSFAIRWATVLQRVGEDCEAEDCQQWGRRLAEGLAHYEDDRYGDAAEMFTALLDAPSLAAPWRAAAFDWRGHLYHLTGQYRKALEDLDLAVELDPEDAEYWVDRGQTYHSLERYDEALADFDRAIELRPEDAGAIASRGETYRLMERYDEALADLNRAIELQPEYAWAIASRGRTYCSLERYDEALADLNRAIELDADDWDFYGRALVYHALGRRDQAQADLAAAIERAEQVYEKEPQRWRNALNLARYHLASGESTEAEQLYRAATSDGAPRHNLREASRDLGDFLALFPDHCQAQAMRDLLQERIERD